MSSGTSWVHWKSCCPCSYNSFLINLKNLIRPYSHLMASIFLQFKVKLVLQVSCQPIENFLLFLVSTLGYADVPLLGFIIKRVNIILKQKFLVLLNVFEMWVATFVKRILLQSNVKIALQSFFHACSDRYTQIIFAFLGLDCRAPFELWFVHLCAATVWSARAVIVDKDLLIMWRIWDSLHRLG